MQQFPGHLNFDLKITPIERISPSRYEALKQCALREVWSANRQPRLLPVHPAARLGTAIHNLLEDAGSGKLSSGDRQALDNRWEELIAEAEEEMRNSWLDKHLVPLKSTLRDYEVRRIRAIESALEVTKLPQSNLKDRSAISIKGGHELWVESQDGLVGGFIDYVYYADGGPLIRDYKSGSIFDENSGEVKSSYETQLKLYAGLYQKTTGVWPERLEIVSLQGAFVQIEFKQDDCVQLLEDAVSDLKDINALIETLQPNPDELEKRLANPNAQNCKHCLFRPGCKAYLRSQNQNGEHAEWPKDVIGTLEDVCRLGNTKIMMLIQPDANRDAGIYVRGVNPDAARHPAIYHLQAGDRIGLFNVYSRCSEHSFVETKTTTIYKMVEG